MGWWGLESCSNDGCWDLLILEDISNPKPEEVLPCLIHAFENHDKMGYWEHDIVVGVVIWLLDHKMIIPDEYLDIAETLHTKLLKAPDHYFDDFTKDERGGRRLFVEQELEIIKAAKLNNGQGSERHVKGLFQKICEAAPKIREAANKEKNK